MYMWAKADAESISNRRWIPKIVGTPLKATNNYSTNKIEVWR